MYKRISFQHPSSTASCRFRRWSRKGYAIFCSLGKHVTIGCLRKNITEEALHKQPGTKGTALDGCKKRNLSQTEEERETGGGISLAVSLSQTELLLLLQGLPAGNIQTIRQNNQEHAALLKNVVTFTLFYSSLLPSERAFPKLSLKGLSIHMTFIFYFSDADNATSKKLYLLIFQHHLS